MRSCDSPEVAEFVRAARSYVGTPFRIGGRSPGFALDCAGVIVCAARAAGVPVHDDRTYGRHPERGVLRRALRKSFGDPVPGERPEVGDVVVFGTKADPSRDYHAGVVVSGGFVHAMEGGAVRLERWRRAWEKLVAARWQIGG